MKKSVKRIVCTALSLTMASALVAEHVLRIGREDASAAVGSTAAVNGVTSSSSVSFRNATGEFDTSKLVTENFNDTVLKAEDVAPKYETRTVMVTLSGKPIADRADETVKEYLNSWAGDRAQAELADEQNAFLRALKKANIPYSLVRTYDTVLNGVAIEINTEYVSAIKKMSGVESVVITTAYAEPKTAESGTGVVTNETDVYATGIYDSTGYAEVYGAGTVVAVLDTGLDYTHPAFQRFESDNVNVAWSKDYVADVLKNEELTAEVRSGSLNVNEVYVSAKVPFAYDYADDDPDVYPSYSNHGTHVAGIIGGYDTSGYTDKDGNPINETFKGVVPDAQLVICKVFTDDLDDKDLGGAVAEDIIAALEDCVTLGVDVINMSLGTSCGFSTTNDGDDEGEMLDAVYKRIQAKGISLICAASNDYSAGYGGVYGTNLASNPDSGTVGSPSTFAGALAVASINGQKAPYVIANKGDNQSYVYYEESRDIDGNPFNFCKDMQALYNKKTFEYVVVPGVGHGSDYTTQIKRLFRENGTGASLGRIALIKRGDTTFEEKVRIAKEMGAAGVMVYNNVSGVIRMNLGEIEDPIPAISITMNAGNALVAGATNRVGTLEVDETYAAGPFMSEFSSWGPTHDLKLKPEITAHGGEITSTVPGGYGEQSGTSMATPNMAGFMALVRSYIKNDLGYTDGVEINRLAMQLTMSTAGTVYDQDNLPYSPRKQGAGVAKLENVIGGTSAYLWTDLRDSEGRVLNDYRPKIELGDDPEKEGEYILNFNLTNFGESALTFNTQHLVMTETLSSDKLTVTEQAYMLKGTQASWYVDGKALEGELTVASGKTVNLSVTLRLSNDDKQYIDNSFKNGMYVEGFLKLLSTSEGQCDLSIPFLGFYGDWEAAPMLDYSAYEVAANAQDASVKDEDKIQASVWETLAYTSYYNEKYILPMGGYVYPLAEGDDKMYVSEEHASVSCYDLFYGEGNSENYLTSTAIKAVYAGLLRNARVVRYSMYNVETGEILIQNKEIYRVGKAYTGGGSGVPANVELELDPLQEGLSANGTYRMDFEFFSGYPEEGEVAREEDTYSFSFTVDYEAPVLEDVRVRYYDYKDGDKEKQRIYLDVDVYDNHYPQAVMLCYPTVDLYEGEEQTILQLATDYPVPVRDAKRNGTTTVSIEITDIYDYVKYNPVYLQLDDYAINTCLYQLSFKDANEGMLPENGEFWLAEGEDNITLDIYGTHKVALEYNDAYKGSVNLSNFIWSTSGNQGEIDVRNGVIVGLRKGDAKVIVSNGRGESHEITVTVTDEKANLSAVPTISFGVMKSALESIHKANGFIDVDAGETFQLVVEKDPWYHPMTDLRIVWASMNESIVSVQALDWDGKTPLDGNIFEIEDGSDIISANITTLKKGTTSITATVQKKNAAGQWENTLYKASVTLNVENEFTVSNYTLTDYNGLGGVVEIPSDMNIWYIGEEAFKDNTNVTKIIIPASVVDIHERAFYNCTALEEVYFVSEQHRVGADGSINAAIDWSELKMIYQQAFFGCPKLRKVDFSNVKTATVAHECFAYCESLTEIVDMPSIGTMHHRAFMNTGLTSIDISGLYMSGESVFANCTALKEITTGKFTAIGKNMFINCTGLSNVVTIHTSKIGEGAFRNCTKLQGVRFVSPEGESIPFDIGANAFNGCGTNAIKFTVTFDGEIIRTIGDFAFVNSKLAAFDFSKMKGLQFLGEGVFANTAVSEIVIGKDVDFTKVQITGVPFASKTITVAANSPYVAENGIIYDADKTVVLFVNDTVTGELAIPSTVTRIAPYAFANSALSKITLHSGVTEIGEGAFYNASATAIDFAGANIAEIPAYVFYRAKISEVVLPSSVIYVGDYAFAESTIVSFEAAGLQELGNYVFDMCKNLGSVNLADSLTKMGYGVFQANSSLQTISLPSVKELGGYTFRFSSALREVTFGVNAETTGEYTFINTSVQNVIFLGNKITEIGEGAFYHARNLTSIDLPDSVTAIGAYAFEGTTKLTSVNLANVVTFGNQAFYNSGVTALTLTSAQYIGDFAFGAQSNNSADVETAYSSVSMPSVKEIGAYAFFNSGLTSVEIPASTTVIKQGAFASSAKLTTITVAEENETFFVLDGVLYRNLNENGDYEAVCYPANLADADKTYALADGTVRVAAYAFYGLNKGMLNKVVLPYSVKTIGDAAFLLSGVKEYVFESIQAPVLEAAYSQEIEQAIVNGSTLPCRGFYYSNFETLIYNFTIGEKSTLAMVYPSNGKGYDNYIYKLYFGVRTVGEELMQDETRACVRMIEEMPDAATVAAWEAWDVTDSEKIAFVNEFSETMKTARLYYNNAMASETQKAFITAEHTEKLFAVEEAFRAVKTKFGVKITVSSIKISPNSTHKTEYMVGDTFDTTGLVITVVYDDYSTVDVTGDAITLVSGKFSSYRKYAEVKCAGKTLRISVTLLENETPDTSDSTSDSTVESSSAAGDSGCNSAIALGGVGCLAALGVVAAMMLKKKKEN